LDWDLVTLRWKSHSNFSVILYVYERESEGATINRWEVALWWH